MRSSPSRADLLVGWVYGRNVLTDLHAHFLTERYVVEATAAGHAHPDGMSAWPEWSLEQHLGLLDRLGIDDAVISISSPGVHFGDDTRASLLARHVNEAAADLFEQSGRRLRFLAALPLPDVARAVDEATAWLGTEACAGVVTHTNAAGRYLGDAALDPLWQVLSDHRKIAFVHPTAPPNWEQVSPERPLPELEFMFETARSLADLLDASVPLRFPGLRVLSTHCGGTLPALVDRLALFRLGAGTVGPEWNDSLAKLWFDCAGTPLPTMLPALLQHVSAERVVYGSDYCFTPAIGVTMQVKKLDEGAAAVLGSGWRELLGTNGEALLAPGV